MNRILYFGMTGTFSQPPLLALLAAGFDVCAVIVPAETEGAVALQPLQPFPPTDLPLINPYLSPNIIHIAWEKGIPVYALQTPNHPAVLAELGRWSANIACVACFNKILPPALLNSVPDGFLNVHPSLLPAYRGPDPIFWQLRQNEQHMGVTIHRLDAGLDTGAIVTQRPLPLPDGLSRHEIDQQMARIGGDLLVDVLRQETIPTIPQDESQATYQPLPQANDFALSTDWSARHAFNFMRGTAEWQRPYSIVIDGKKMWIKTAVTFDATAVLGSSFRKFGSELQIQFSPGILTART